MSRCRGRARHRRTAFGTVGMRTPVCLYCGSPNPRALTESEWVNLIDWARDHYMGGYVRTALEWRQSSHS